MLDNAQDKSENVHELTRLSQQLLDAIDQQKWDVYSRLCDPTLTAFEPEANGHLVAGMNFHRFYFQMESTGRASRSTISSPDIRVMVDSAVVTYVRLKQVVNADGSASTHSFEETRIWQRQAGEWKHVHFHRSPG